VLLSLGLARSSRHSCQVSGHQVCLALRYPALDVYDAHYYLQAWSERFQWLLALNPLSGLIEAFRYVVVPSMLSTGACWNSPSSAREFFSPQSVGLLQEHEKAMADLV